MIEFARPLIFVLLPLPILVWSFWPPVSVRQSLIVPSSIAGALQAATRREPSLPARFLAVWWPIAVGWIALLAALAEPNLKSEKLIVPTGRDLVFAIDFSASMAVEDIGVSDKPLARIYVARDLVGRFVSAREGDRIGLIAFASEAFVIAPLTFDGVAVASMLDELSIGLPGRKTDIGRAIGMTVQMFRDMPKAERVLVVLSDGETNAGGLTALDAARLARDHGIVIHMIGFAETIEPGNEIHMREIAASTGGLYLSATSGDALESALKAVSESTPISAKPDDLHARRDLGQIAALLALAAACIAGWRELQV
jgi:Ca-activated chloride channel family protein